DRVSCCHREGEPASSRGGEVPGVPRDGRGAPDLRGEGIHAADGCEGYDIIDIGAHDAAMSPVWGPLWLSLRIAIAATVLVALVAVPLAFVMARRRFAGQSIVEALIVVPLVLPP